MRIFLSQTLANLATTAKVASCGAMWQVATLNLMEEPDTDGFITVRESISVHAQVS